MPDYALMNRCLYEGKAREVEPMTRAAVAEGRSRRMPRPDTRCSTGRRSPAQVKAWDEFEEVKVDLAPRFAERIDRTAQRLGLTQSDASLAQRRWNEEAERSGSPQEVARVVREEIEAASP